MAATGRRETTTPPHFDLLLCVVENLQKCSLKESVSSRTEESCRGPGDYERIMYLLLKYRVGAPRLPELLNAVDVKNGMVQG